jgi:Integrase core domain
MGAVSAQPFSHGPQFIARDFKEFIRIAGMTHVRTSPGYPQSNGKLERWYKSLKSECIRPGTPLTKEDAVRLIQTYVDHYNGVRLHSAKPRFMRPAIASSSRHVSSGNSGGQPSRLHILRT